MRLAISCCRDPASVRRHELPSQFLQHESCGRIPRRPGGQDRNRDRSEPWNAPGGSRGIPADEHPNSWSIRAQSMQLAKHSCHNGINCHYRRAHNGIQSGDARLCPCRRMQRIHACGARSGCHTVRGLETRDAARAEARRAATPALDAPPCADRRRRDLLRARAADRRRNCGRRSRRHALRRRAARPRADEFGHGIRDIRTGSGTARIHGPLPRLRSISSSASTRSTSWKPGSTSRSA